MRMIFSICWRFWLSNQPRSNAAQTIPLADHLTTGYLGLEPEKIATDRLGDRRNQRVTIERNT